jgi:3-oxoacyl-[acyl-carrier protein] reductase
MDLQLKGKRALVLGSSAGIGRAIAEVLIEEGALVALCSRNESRLSQVARELSASTYFTADLTRAGEGTRVAKAARDHWGGLDILVVNTGGPKAGPFMEVAEKDWFEAFQNLWMSTIEAMKEVLPGMKAKGFGRIILVTSLSAKEPLNGLTISNSLRAGLTGLVKSLSNEVASFGVTVNAILPGYTDTERLKELGLKEEKIKQLVPAGRLAQPREMGTVAAFLASPLSGYLTGLSLPVDGGALKGH